MKFIHYRDTLELFSRCKSFFGSSLHALKKDRLVVPHLHTFHVFVVCHTLIKDDKFVSGGR